MKVDYPARERAVLCWPTTTSGDPSGLMREYVVIP
jgi:hypothetical protein